MKPKWIDRVFLIIAALSLAALLFSTLWRFLPHDQINKLLNANKSTWLLWLYYPLLYWVQPFAFLVIRLTIAVWLFLQARKQRFFPWFWTLMGLALGPLALAVYYLIDINRRLERLEKRETEQSPGAYSNKATDGLSENAQE